MRNSSPRPVGAADRRPISSTRPCLTTALAIALLALGGAELPAVTGIVDEVMPGGAAAEAGLLPGDVLWGWERPARGPYSALAGSVDSPYRLTLVEDGEAPRGPVRLFGRREGRPVTVLLETTPWRFEVRPDLPAEVVAGLDGVRAGLARGDLEAIARVEALAGEVADPDGRSWLLLRAGLSHGAAGRTEQAAAIYRRALDAAADLPLARQAILARIGTAWLGDAVTPPGEHPAPDGR